MPIPTIKGQYRKVRYSDDGCCIYQCLWCLNTIEIRDDPRYWCFCPKCGKSWFTKLECRDHNVPRWYYDRWGNGNEPDDPSLWRMYSQQQPTSEWVIQCRTKWFRDEWGKWKFEYSSDKDPYSPDYKWAYSMLNQCRLRHTGPGPDDVKFQYRARLRKKT